VSDQEAAGAPLDRKDVAPPVSSSSSFGTQISQIYNKRRRKRAAVF